MAHEIVILTPEPETAAAWLTDNLFFAPAGENTLHNGSCTVRLQKGTPQPTPALAKGQYTAGIAHLALRAADIKKALTHCKEKRLDLMLTDDHEFYNPKVYGEGEYYFNIRSPFGVTVEISQHVQGAEYGQTKIIEGLDHMGLPSADFDAQLASLKAQGFAEEFAPVTNHNDAEGTIRCCMMRKDALVLEVYQFLDMTPVPMQCDAPLQLHGVAFV